MQGIRNGASNSCEWVRNISDFRIRSCYLTRMANTIYFNALIKYCYHWCPVMIKTPFPFYEDIASFANMVKVVLVVMVVGRWGQNIEHVVDDEAHIVNIITCYWPHMFNTMNLRFLLHPGINNMLLHPLRSVGMAGRARNGTTGLLLFKEMHLH